MVQEVFFTLFLKKEFTMFDLSDWTKDQLSRATNEMGKLQAKLYLDIDRPFDSEYPIIAEFFKEVAEEWEGRGYQ